MPVEKPSFQNHKQVAFTMIAGLAAVFAVLTACLSASAASQPVREALMLDAKVSQGRQAISGRVLLQAGSTVWTQVAGQPGLRLQARATMLEADVVEIETRILGQTEENAKMIVRLGELAELNVAQMEGSVASKNRPDTNLGVKVLKVRF